MLLGFFDYEEKLLLSKKFEKRVKTILKANISVIPSYKLREVYYKSKKYCALEKRLKNVEQTLEINNHITAIIVGVICVPLSVFIFS